MRIYLIYSRGWQKGPPPGTLRVKEMYPPGVEVEIPVHKTMARDLLKGGSYRTPPGSDRVKTC